MVLYMRKIEQDNVVIDHIGTTYAKKKNKSL